jgi:3-deoxy-D-manno-octulosonic-acid transferase
MPLPGGRLLKRFRLGLRSRILLDMLFVEPFRILVGGRRRLRWLLDHWGLYARGTPEGTVWIHGSATAEMRLAIALVRSLPEELPVVITTNATEDVWLGREALGRRAEITSFPFPFPLAMRGFLRSYSPGHLICFEDPRPLEYLHMVRQELPTIVLGSWIKKWAGIRRDLVEKVKAFGVRGEQDRERFMEIGVPRERISRTGEMKLDAVPDPLPEIEARMQDLAGGRPILVAGSTHFDEDPQVLDAFEHLGGGGRAMLILARRHPKLAYGSIRLLRERGVDFVLRSRLPVSGRPAVVLLDKVGELAALYRLATAAFVGASLSPAGGGHNPIEPACFAVPIAVGPYMANFQPLADLFDRAGAWQRVADAEELARTWAAWLDDPELARRPICRASSGSSRSGDSP